MEMEKIGDIIEKFRQYGMPVDRGSDIYSFGDSDTCRKMFYDVLKAVDRSIDEPIPIPEHEEIIDWMTDTKGKGLILVGDCGRGKSSILTGVIPVIFNMKFKKLIFPMSATDMVNAKNLYQDYFYCIDDIGTESVKNHFGEKSEVFATVMDDAERFFKPVFISTNLTGQQIIDRYGKRTMDRIVRLCRVVKFKGNSFRK